MPSPRGIIGLARAVPPQTWCGPPSGAQPLASQESPISMVVIAALRVLVLSRHSVAEPDPTGGCTPG